jgi:hypothetical protein
MSRRLGFHTQEIRDRSAERFGVLPDFLSRKDASSFIKLLQDEISQAPTDSALTDTPPPVRSTR